MEPAQTERADLNGSLANGNLHAEPQIENRAPEPWHPQRYSAQPLHARRSHKATKNLGKLLKDANACHARFAVIIEDETSATVKDLDTGEQWTDRVNLDDLPHRLNDALRT